MDGIRLLKEFDDFVDLCSEEHDEMLKLEKSIHLRNEIVSLLNKYNDLYEDYDLLRFGSEE